MRVVYWILLFLAQAATEAEAASRGGIHAAVGVAAAQAISQITRHLRPRSGEEHDLAILLDVQKKLRLMLSRPQ